MRPKKHRVTRSSRAKKVTRARGLTRATKSVRPGKAMRTERAASAQETAHTEAGVRPSSQFGAWALVLSGIGVMAGVILIGRPAPDRVEVAAANPPHGDVVVQAQPVTLPTHMASKQPAKVADLPPTPPTLLPLTGPMPALKTTAIAKTTEMAHTDEPAATTLASYNASTLPPHDEHAAMPASVQESALVTITGCLETDEEIFRLNDTAGSDAPKSRSWKTGFLKKRSATIAVVDASGVGLPAHVGKRVALTGLLVDRDMQVRSLRRVAATCDR